METWLFLVLFSSQVLIGSSKVSDSQYASMPKLFHWDNWDNCMLYGDKALYCMITFQIYPNETNEIWNVIKEVTSDKNNYDHALIRHGVCIPETCPEIPEGLLRNDSGALQGFTECYNRKHQDKDLKGEITEIRCETAETPYPINSFDIGFAIFIGLYIMLVTFASLYEGLLRHQDEENYKTKTGITFGKVMAAFSVPKNWLRLTHVDWDNPDVQRLRCIQGVRFYNMVLVIFSHTVFLSLGSPVSNLRYAETTTETIAYMFLDSGGFVVSTFFLITYFLLSYHFFTTFEKRKLRLSHLGFAFFSRYIRLTPPLAVIIALNSSWIVRAGRGPFWNVLIGEEYRRCRKNWWSNLLYINNYVNKKDMCLAQTWYLGIDTQLFIISLVSLYFIIKNPKMIRVILGSILAVHIVTYFLQSYFNSYPLTISPTPEDLYKLKMLEMDHYHLVLNTLTSNLPGLVGGLGFGYAYYRYKDQKLFNSKLSVAIWWVTVWGLGLGVIIIPGTFIYKPGFENNYFYESLLGSVNRVLFVFGIGYMIFGVTQGIGWVMKWVLEFRPTYILGRLTYSTYLIHSLVIRMRLGARRSPTYVTEYVMFTDLLLDIAGSFLAATFLTLLFEMPTSALQKLLFESSTSPQFKGKNGRKKLMELKSQ